MEVPREPRVITPVLEDFDCTLHGGTLETTEQIPLRWSVEGKVYAHEQIRWFVGQCACCTDHHVLGILDERGGESKEYGYMFRMTDVLTAYLRKCCPDIDWNMLDELARKERKERGI